MDNVAKESNVRTIVVTKKPREYDAEQGLTTRTEPIGQQ